VVVVLFYRTEGATGRAERSMDHVAASLFDRHGVDSGWCWRSLHTKHSNNQNADESFCCRGCLLYDHCTPRLWRWKQAPQSVAKVYTTCQYKNCSEPQANNQPNINLKGCGDLNCGCGWLWPASKQPRSTYGAARAAAFYGHRPRRARSTARQRSHDSTPTTMSGIHPDADAPSQVPRKPLRRVMNNAASG
jgi:hypothetical protein